MVQNIDRVGGESEVVLGSSLDYIVYKRTTDNADKIETLARYIHSHGAGYTGIHQDMTLTITHRTQKYKMAMGSSLYTELGASDKIFARKSAAPAV